ncbi:hypothetical protein G6011_04945 [Alternaria panax]|uniref:Uncharacterized protein n=1 Tax=Alternaria panax TaxID=48097 RepID=A0AAD4FB08_9PLEO|nr:hypothetical protein G6011_04945 [Alternaria panax]
MNAWNEKYLQVSLLWFAESARNKADPSVVTKDDQEAYLRQARFAQGFIREEEPDPPMARTYSYQQPHALPKVQRAFDRTYATRGTQREPAAEPFATATQSKHMDHGQPTQTTSPLAPQGRSSGQIQVTGQWDKTPIKLSFDPDASGEAFYQTFFQWAVKRKRGADLDRERTTLWLKASKATPDTQAYDLELKEDELEELWNTAVEWIQENKNTKAPHLYATVEMEAG